MKNLRRVILILLALTFACSLFAACSYADVADYVAKTGDYIYNAVRQDGDYNGKVFGALMSGSYFGRSNIFVSVAVYSSDALPVNFDVRSDKLTVAQAQVRNKLVSVFNDIDAFITSVDVLADTQTVTSDVYRYNHAEYGQKLEINVHTYNMLQIAREMYIATDGAFNPAVYRLVDLWGFSSRTYPASISTDGGIQQPSEPKQSYDGQWVLDNLSPTYRIPDDKYVEAFSSKAFVDFSDKSVILSEENGKYYVTKNVAPVVVDGETFEQWIDLGGIAKGYVADYVDGKLRSEGIDRFDVDVGSSSMTFGKNYDGQSAAIGIASPFTRQSFVGVDVCDAAMSTSGQYLRKYAIDGVEYAHIIDGSTGRPAQTGVKLVSVIASNEQNWASKGDCLTTALTVMGRDKIVDFMNGYLKDNGITVYAVCEENGKKQILSNTEYDSLAYVNAEIANYSWSVAKDGEGNFVYLPDAENIKYEATAPFIRQTDYTWLLIVLGVIVALGAIAVVVYYFVKGKRNAVNNVVNAKRDRPFKVGDVGVYVVVLLVIAALFVAFLGGEHASDEIKVVRVVDVETQQVLFVCDVSARSWNAYDGTNGWTVQVEAGDNLIVTFTKQFDGQERFNKMVVDVSDGVSVKMEDSLCGAFQECVRNFPAVTVPNSAIVCSPNRLKVVTE